MTKNNDAGQGGGAVTDLIHGLATIAAVTGLSPEGVRHAWTRGRIPVVKVGSSWLANESALRAAAAAGAIRAPSKKAGD
jgi:hypothetical protein